MAGPRLTALRKQFDDVKNGIDTIERAATAASRDLTPDETADLDKLYERAATLKPEIEAEVDKENSLTAVSDVLSRVSGGSPAPIVRAAPQGAEMSAGEYLAAYYQAFHPNGSSAPDEFVERASLYIERAQQTTADTAGIIPTPIIGNVIKFADSARPVFNSLTSRPMPPKGKTFERPRVTQRVLVGTQTEGQSLASQKMTLTSDTVTKATQGGTLDLTHQDIDWTEPGALEIVVQDFVDMYAEWTEGLACTAVETAGLGASALYDETDVGTIVESYVDAIVAVYGTAKRFPDTAWLDLASWATLASTTNTNNDKTALTMLKEALADLNVGAMRFIVGPQLAANTRIIGASSLIEAYEQQKGLLRAETPSTLTVQLAYAGYTAFWSRTEGFVRLETA